MPDILIITKHRKERISYEKAHLHEQTCLGSYILSTYIRRYLRAAWARVRCDKTYESGAWAGREVVDATTASNCGFGHGT